MTGLSAAASSVLPFRHITCTRGALSSIEMGQLKKNIIGYHATVPLNSRQIKTVEFYIWAVTQTRFVPSLYDLVY